MQLAVDVLDDQVDSIGRQTLIAEEDVEHAVVGVHGGTVVEVPLIAPIEGGAERQQRIGDEHDADGDADRPEQHAERARPHDFLSRSARTARELGRARPRRFIDDLGYVVGGMGDESGAFALRHVVHVF